MHNYQSTSGRKYYPYIDGIYAIMQSTIEVAVAVVVGIGVDHWTIAMHSHVNVLVARQSTAFHDGQSVLLCLREPTASKAKVQIFTKYGKSVQEYEQNGSQKPRQGHTKTRDMYAHIWQNKTAKNGTENGTEVECRHMQKLLEKCPQK